MIISNKNILLHETQEAPSILLRLYCTEFGSRFHHECHFSASFRLLAQVPRLQVIYDGQVVNFIAYDYFVPDPLQIVTGL